ncbi:MAG: signal peptidase I [Chthoniobacterales bacterium]|nr:signal peptidase I [Chthoniobacterales bacterium]
MFTPRYIKHSKLLVRHAQKYLRYKKDILSDEDRGGIVGGIAALEGALKQRDKEGIKSKAEALDQKLHSLTPVTWESHWRENVEVILVAIIVAVGIRSYFLQPFKIPTGSMQPTLNGIIGHPRNEPAPNIARQVAEFFILGRNYINVVSAVDDRVRYIEPQKFGFFFTFSRIICDRQSFLVYAPPDTLKQDFKVTPGASYRAGEVIARGAVDTGDQVFVDKVSYNFVKPKRGDVFVFRTNDVVGIPADPQTGAPFYIKRLVGLGGDELRIEPPLLFINGQPAEGPSFARVMSTQDGYRGYALAGTHLAEFNRPFQVPEGHFFAMGDNSYNSYDSRYWGAVQEYNLVGRGLLVYWPFNRHWGLIR